MFVWFSPTFSRPDVADHLKELTDKPLITSFIPHTLLDLAGIRTEHFDATRSIVNSQYDGTRHRITVDDIDFDK
jgi:heptose-I-phosphate ethanolaminephosphotransferase